ncbi:MAG: ribosome silencing factor [Acidimicrobiales bacterium]
MRVLEDTTVRQLCLEAAKACYEKGGESTVVLGVGKSLGIADAFVITSATSSRQVRTIADAVEDRVKAFGGGGPISIEGLTDARWVLMDFGAFVVHAMLEEARDFYQLDGLWSDSETWDWAPVAAAAGGS